MKLTKLVKIMGLALIVDPLLRVLFFKLSTKLELSVVWGNIADNSLSSIPMFLEFWVLAPLTGILLLSAMRIGQHIYLLLTLFNIYSIFTYEAFSWPYFAKTPHWTALILMSFNMGMVITLYWPHFKKYILSKHLRKIWDARGRNSSDLKSTLFIDKKGEEVSGRVVNISTGGVLFLVSGNKETIINKNDKGLIVIRDIDNNFLNLKMEVVNSRVKNGECFLGIEFREINSSTYLKILDFLYKNTSSISSEEYSNLSDYSDAKIT